MKGMKEPTMAYRSFKPVNKVNNKSTSHLYWDEYGSNKGRKSARHHLKRRLNRLARRAARQEAQEAA